MTIYGLLKQTDPHYHIIDKYLYSFYFLKVEYSLDLKFESIMNSYNMIKDNIEEMDMEDIKVGEQGEEQMVGVASIASPTIIIVQPGMDDAKKTKRKKKKRAKFLKFEDDDFSSEVSFKVSVRTSGESCQDLTLRWSGQR